jgi:hypothetical protein
MRRGNFGTLSKLCSENSFSGYGFHEISMSNDEVSRFLRIYSEIPGKAEKS